MHLMCGGEVRFRPNTTDVLLDVVSSSMDEVRAVHKRQTIESHSPPVLVTHFLAAVLEKAGVVFSVDRCSRFTSGYVLLSSVKPSIIWNSSASNIIPFECGCNPSLDIMSIRASHLPYVGR